MTTTDMIVNEAERLQARVRELEAALKENRPSHYPADCDYCVIGAPCPVVQRLTRIDRALTPSEPRR